MNHIEPGVKAVPLSPKDIALRTVLLFVLCAPMLLFNGHEWLHVTMLYKWLGAFIPIAYLAGFIGLMLLSGKAGWKTDAFALAWLCVLMLFPLQLLLPGIKNPVDWLRGWLFISALGGAYLVFLNIFKPGHLPTVLRCLLAAGALSTLFGFLQQAGVAKDIPFIVNSPLPDRFLANTGVDNVLGAVLALSSFSGIWLLSHRRAGIPSFLYDVPMLIVNLTGLWKTGARASMLAILCAVAAFLVLREYTGERPASARSILLKRILPLLLTAAVLFAVLPGLLPLQRRDIQADLTIQAFSPNREGRFAIWAVTLEMIREHPVLGVGLGNYKWNYLDSLPAYYKNWNLPMRYSLWAHSEYLQWTAETGTAGALLLAGLLILWGTKIRRRFAGGTVPSSTIWGVCALLILAVDALFSRPFHHTESAVWLPFAFAVINAEALPELRASRPFRALFGGIVALVAAFGIYTLVESLPAERRFAWIGHPNSFFLMAGEEKVQLPGTPLLLRDRAEEVRWKQSIMRARLRGQTEFYREVAEHLEADYALRPRFAIIPPLVEMHAKLGNTERFNELLRLLPPDKLQELLRKK